MGKRRRSRSHSRDRYGRNISRARHENNLLPIEQAYPLSTENKLPPDDYAKSLDQFLKGCNQGSDPNKIIQYVEELLRSIPENTDRRVPGMLHNAAHKLRMIVNNGKKPESFQQGQVLVGYVLHAIKFINVAIDRDWKKQVRIDFKREMVRSTIGLVKNHLFFAEKKEKPFEYQLKISKLLLDMHLTLGEKKYAANVLHSMSTIWFNAAKECSVGSEKREILLYDAYCAARDAVSHANDLSHHFMLAETAEAYAKAIEDKDPARALYYSRLAIDEIEYVRKHHSNFGKEPVYTNTRMLAYKTRGRIAYNLEDIDKAIACFEEAREIKRSYSIKDSETTQFIDHMLVNAYLKKCLGIEKKIKNLSNERKENAYKNEVIPIYQKVYIIVYRHPDNFLRAKVYFRLAHCLAFYDKNYQLACEKMRLAIGMLEGNQANNADSSGRCGRDIFYNLSDRYRNLAQSHRELADNDWAQQFGSLEKMSIHPGRVGLFRDASKGVRGSGWLSACLSHN